MGPAGVPPRKSVPWFAIARKPESSHRETTLESRRRQHLAQRPGIDDAVDPYTATSQIDLDHAVDWHHGHAAPRRTSRPSSMTFLFVTVVVAMTTGAPVLPRGVARPHRHIVSRCIRLLDNLALLLLRVGVHGPRNGLFASTNPPLLGSITISFTQQLRRARLT